MAGEWRKGEVQLGVVAILNLGSRGQPVALPALWGPEPPATSATIIPGTPQGSWASLRSEAL